ncbi:hypothetical protein, partial [Paraburkholderia sp.]|uniref:hypothetical protein n=1 Tax=Paraburkholderia sp. TaxID=1926495 RepID=UPI002389DD01
ADIGEHLLTCISQMPLILIKRIASPEIGLPVTAGQQQRHAHSCTTCSRSKTFKNIYQFSNPNYFSQLISILQARRLTVTLTLLARFDLKPQTGT